MLSSIFDIEAAQTCGLRLRTTSSVGLFSTLVFDSAPPTPRTNEYISITFFCIAFTPLASRSHQLENGELDLPRNTMRLPRNPFGINGSILLNIPQTKGW